ncbi:MAG TPA: hypothetical protein VG266_03650 [Candidatus Dormibacteraeota bacterium]|nr:hypothetical protein [Candidatus Dormibacteraeota bacterium]
MVTRGKTAVAVTTAEFTPLAHTMAANAGRSGLRVHELPYPLDTRPEPEVREIARAHYRPLLRTLGVRD